MATLDHRQNARCYAHILRLIYSNPWSVNDLVEETGLAYNTVIKFMRSLHDQRMIYVQGWQEDKAGHRTIVLWKWGPFRKDAVFEKKTMAEMVRNSRANVLERWNNVNPHMKCQTYWDLQRLKKELKARRSLNEQTT